MSWDVFICHASEDKETIATPLVAALVKAGLRVWYDDLTLALGDSLSRAIEQGLSASQFGVVILSPHFFAKKWPQRELNGLVAREEHRDKVILPVWHGVTHEDVVRFSPSLADKIAVSTDQGVPAVVDEILRVVRLEAPPTEPAEAVVTEPIAPQPDITPPSVEKTEVQVWRAPKTSSTPPRQSRAPGRRKPRQGQEIAPSITNTIGMKFVLIPAGSFMMGSPPTDGRAHDNERPAYRVTITQPFYLGKYEVTQAQWQGVMGSNPSKFVRSFWARFKGELNNRPVEQVSWNDVQEFIQKLNTR